MCQAELNERLLNWMANKNWKVRLSNTNDGSWECLWVLGNTSGYGKAFTITGAITKALENANCLAVAVAQCE